MYLQYFQIHCEKQIFKFKYHSVYVCISLAKIMNIHDFIVVFLGRDADELAAKLVEEQIISESARPSEAAPEDGKCKELLSKYIF